MSEMNLASNKSVVWYQQEPSEVARLLSVDPAQGLSKEKAAKRLEQFGPNTLTAKKKNRAGRLFCASTRT